MTFSRSRWPWMKRAVSWVRAVAVTGVLAVGVYLVICVALGISLAESTLRMHPRAVFTEAAFRTRMSRQFHAGVQDVRLQANDGATLRAWYVQPPERNGRAVILLHGIAGNRVDVSGFADIFLAKGYDVLLPDSREHGESGGRVATFGLLERDDVRRWTGWLRQRAPGCTYLLGESMGAAIGVEATAVTPQLCAAAVEDPFARFEQVVYERLGHETGLGTHFWRTAGLPVVRSAIGWAHVRYGIWLPDAAPVVSIAQSRTPVLLMTGTADDNVLMHHAVDLEKSCGGRCALWIVPGANHGGISSVAGAEFGRRLLAWFGAHDTVRTEVPPLAVKTSGGASTEPLAAFAPWPQGR